MKRRFKFDLSGCVFLGVVVITLLPLIGMICVAAACAFEAVDTSGSSVSLERLEILDKNHSSGGSYTQFINVGNSVLVPVTTEDSPSWSLRVKGPDGEKVVSVAPAVYRGKNVGDLMYVTTRKGWITGATYYSAP